MFATDSLLKKDKAQLDIALKYFKGLLDDWTSRINYRVGLDKKDTWNPDVIIIDEVDAIAFAGLDKFHEATKERAPFIIGLTARVDLNTPKPQNPNTPIDLMCMELG